jgi:hypothetical protein
MKMLRRLSLISLLLSFHLQASPCFEAYKRFAKKNTDARNDELIALEMLLDDQTLEMKKTESYYFLKNAVYDLSKDKIDTTYAELKAHIYQGFDTGAFCNKGGPELKPIKTAGQIIRLAKKRVKESYEYRHEVAKTFPAQPTPVPPNSFISERELAGKKAKPR